MKKPLVSILIPVYKVKEYLPDCIESALEQTYREIEIIIVDDESPDCCGEICNSYAMKDSRIKVIHQQNTGLSGARITGINHSSGDFVFHLDGDDSLPKDAIERLVEKQVKGDFDLVFGNHYLLKNGEKTIINRDYDQDKQKLLKGFVSNLGYHHFVWGVLIRRNIYIENKIQPQIGVNVGEDLQVLPQLVFFSKRIAKINAAVYIYNQSNATSLTSCYSYSRILQDLETLRILQKFLQDVKQENLKERLLKTELNLVVGNIYVRADNQDKQEYYELVKYAKRSDLRSLWPTLHYSSRIMLQLNNPYLASAWKSLFNFLIKFKAALYNGQQI